MKKLLNIGWKDLIVTFRDRAALIMMLAAPFILTLAFGVVTGGFSGSDSTGPTAIPVVVVNEDQGDFGSLLESMLSEPQFEELLDPSTMANKIVARQQVEDDQVAAAVIIPAAFTASVIPDLATGIFGEPAPIEVYSSPARPISAGVVKSVVESFVTQLETGMVSSVVATGQLVANGLIPIEDTPAVGPAIALRALPQSGEAQLIAVTRTTASGEEEEAFNALAYFSVSMALMFLMYTVAIGGRSILTERDAGTLPRMLITPSSNAQVLGGKVVGIVLTGLAQVTILVVATSLMFSLDWGDPVAVALLVLSVVAASTGWGILLAASAKTPGQITSVGTALMLLFGILGGAFFTTAAGGGLMEWLRMLTPMAWAMDGFEALARGEDISQVLGSVVALWIMAAVLFVIAVTVFRRRRVVAA